MGGPALCCSRRSSRRRTSTDTAYNHYSLLRSIEDLFGLSHLGYAGQAGLASFGSDVFAAEPAPPATTSTATTTTTTATTPVAPICRAQTTGAVLGKPAVKKGGGKTMLVVAPRRSGTLTFQVHPAKGRALAVQHRTLKACKSLTVALPSGHGSVQLTAAAGTRHDRSTVRF